MSGRRTRRRKVMREGTRGRTYPSRAQALAEPAARKTRGLTHRRLIAYSDCTSIAIWTEVLAI